MTPPDPTPLSNHSKLLAVAAATGRHGLARGALRLRRDGSLRQRMLTYSRPAMENLHRQLDSPSLTVLLADPHGAILGTVGPPNTLTTWCNDAADWAADPSGAADPSAHACDEPTWTAEPLRLERTAAWQAGRETVPLALSRLADLRHLLGIAAPIREPYGGLLGIVDIESTRLQQLDHAQSLLQMTAEMIEHRLIQQDDRGFLILRLHPRADMIGTPFEALAVFDHDSRLVSTNRTARSLLPQEDNSLLCHQFFEAQWAGLVGFAALAKPDPFIIRTVTGTRLFAVANLR